MKLSIDKKVYTQEVAHDIVEKFENLLDRHNIDIPDEDRELEDDSDNTARIYGMTYAEILEEVEDIIIELLNDNAIDYKSRAWNDGYWYWRRENKYDAI